MLSKTRVIKHFGSVAAVAAFFGIEVQAVYQWKKFVPRERELELMVRLPNDFGERAVPSKRNGKQRLAQVPADVNG